MTRPDIEIVSVNVSSTGELLDLINNLEIRQPLRRFAPQYYAVFVDRRGQLVLVARSKTKASVDDLSAIRDKECPGTCFFLAPSGLFTSEVELQERIDDCVRAYSVAPSSAPMEERTIDGKKVLLIGSDAKRTKKKSN